MRMGYLGLGLPPSNAATGVATVAPDAPSSLTADLDLDATDTINLAWTDNSTNETGFRVERSTTGGAPWTVVTTTAANVVTYSDSGLTPGTTYTYQIVAVNGAGDSDPSNSASDSVPSLDIDFGGLGQGETFADETFTRTGVGTLWDPTTGYLTYSDHNYLKNSSTVGGTGWTGGGATITLAQTDPLGGATACKVETLTTTGFWRTESIPAGMVAGNVLSVGVWVKQITSSGTNLRIQNAYGASAGQWDIDLSLLSGGWEQLTKDHAAVTETTPFAWHASGAGLHFKTSSGNADIYIAFPHYNLGPNLTGYVATGVPVHALDNIPRLSRIPGTASVGRLIEGAATNILTYSRTFTNAAWTKTNTATLAADATGIDGATSATTLVDSGATGTGSVYVTRAATVTSAAQTLSVFAKADQLGWLHIVTSNFDAAANKTSSFNLTAGSMGTIGHTTGRMELQPNGYYRCSVTFTTTTDLTGDIAFYVGDGDADITVDLDGTSSIIIDQADLTATAYPTTPIPTWSAARTRGAEVSKITGAAAAAILNTAEGTLFVEFAYLGAGSTEHAGLRWVFNLGGASTERHIIMNTGGFIGVQTRENGTNHVDLATTLGREVNTTTRLAYAYKANDCELVVDGVSAGTDGSSVMPALIEVEIGNYHGVNQMNGIIVACKLYKTRLA